MIQTIKNKCIEATETKQAIWNPVSSGEYTDSAKITS